MSNASAVIFVDDSDPTIRYGPGWTKYAEAGDIEGLIAWAENTPNSTMSYSFNGTSISFTGNTPPGEWANLTVSIDGGADIFASTHNPGYDQIYRAWYNSPLLEDGNHTILLKNLTNIALDYMTITAGPTTPLNGRTIIVDDDDPELIYSGNWHRLQQIFQPYAVNSIDVTAYMNTTHSSNTNGDTVTLQFEGSSVVVYGILRWEFNGTVSPVFIVDGSTSTRAIYNIESDGVDNTGGGYLDQPNFQFFSTSLPPGNHTLLINITNVSGAQAFVLDHIEYQSTFSSLAAKPNFPSTIPLASSPTTSASPTNISVPSHSTTPAGAIAGGVIGGCVLIIVFVVILWNTQRCRDYRKSRRDTRFSEKSKDVAAPFIISSSQTGEVGSKSTSKLETAFTSSLSPTSSPITETDGVISNPAQTVKNRNAAAISTNIQVESNVTPSASASGRQAEHRRRIQDLQELLAQLERDTTDTANSGNREQDIADLHRRIELLTEENARLQAESRLTEVPPPAYTGSVILSEENP